MGSSFVRVVARCAARVFCVSAVWALTQGVSGVWQVRRRVRARARARAWGVAAWSCGLGVRGAPSCVAWVSLAHLRREFGASCGRAIRLVGCGFASGWACGLCVGRRCRMPGVPSFERALRVRVRAEARAWGLWACVSGGGSSRATWLILPVVICLSQRLSHACLSISDLYCETANGSLNQLWFI